MTRKKTKSTGLGMGLDALIKSKTRDKKEPKDEFLVKEKKSVYKPKKEDMLRKPDSKMAADPQKLKKVTSEVEKNPRITLWSARSAAVLRYLKKTQPEFSISKEASELIEGAVQEKYPEIWELFKDI